MTGTSVAVIGSATIDKVVQGRKSVFQLGGVVTYAGLTFRRHEIETLIVCNVADQNKSILQILREEGIHVLRGHTKNTTHFINHVDGNNRWQEIPLNADPINAEQVRSILPSVGHLHLGPLHPYDIEPKAITLIDETKLFISLDVQGYLRCTKNNLVRLHTSENLTDALLRSHAVKADETELTPILDFYNMSLSELMHTFKIDEMVITAGPHGGLIRRFTGEEIRYDAKPISYSVDSTGLGDVFFAAYLIYRFYKGKNISIASELAASLAARQIEGRYISKETLSLEG